MEALKERQQRENLRNTAKMEKEKAKEEARKEAILRLKGFNVVGSMENPPTNPQAATQAKGGQG